MKELVEALEIHDKLNPKIFDTDMNLLPDVKNKILEIVEEFKANVKGMTGMDINPVDIHLLGSNASYNYTDKSDLDVHLVLNFEMIDANEDLVQALFNLQKTEFNKEYDVSVHGIDVEIYVEDIRANTVSNGIYSVMSDQWIKKPEPITDVPEVDIEDELDEWKDKITDILSNDDIMEISNTIDELYLIRKNGLATDGEYGKGNQLFKEIRNLGLLDELKEKYIKLRSKELTLESRYKATKSSLNENAHREIEVYSYIMDKLFFWIKHHTYPTSKQIEYLNRLVTELGETPEEYIEEIAEVWDIGETLSSADWYTLIDEIIKAICRGDIEVSDDINFYEIDEEDDF